MPFHQVLSLYAEHLILIRQLNHLLVALSPCTFVGEYGQLRVTLLTEPTHHLSIVVLVVQEEVLRVLGSIDLYLSKGVMDLRDLVALGDTGI